ncbi:MAG: hypothetical protein IJ445_01570 [Clostridia bacterium]|nr:hypothetical protein [Clostridia bacterium]
MNLSMRISKKTQKSECKIIKKVKSFFIRLSKVKYDILILIESISLVMAVLACLFRKDRDTSFFASVSALIGAYLVLCATYRSKTNSQSKKFEYIISVDND